MYDGYRAAAVTPGFAMSPDEPGFFTQHIALTGRQGDRDVQIHRWIGRYLLETHVHLRRPLDLGLDVSAAGQPRYPGAFDLRFIGKLFARKDVEVGDPELDEALAIFGDEPGRVASLVHPLRETWLGWSSSGATFQVTDGEVILRRHRSNALLETGDDVAADVPAALSLVRAMEKLAPQIQPAAQLASYVPAFEALAASSSDLALSRTPLGVGGTLRSRVVDALVTRKAAGHFLLHLRAGVRGAMPPGLFVRGRGPATTAGAEPTGDPEFDALFERLPTPVPPLDLPAESRAALVGLARSGYAVALGPSGLYAQRALSDGLALEADLRTACDALDALERSLEQGSAYR